MNPVYLKLFRSEISRLTGAGGFHGALEFLDNCQTLYAKSELKVVALLEKARFWFYMGKWDDCLSVLDKVELHEHLLTPDDKALFFLISARLHQGYGDLNQALAFLEIAVGEAEVGDGPRKIEAILDMGSLFQRIGEHERGDDFLAHAEELLKEHPDTELEARLNFEKGLVEVRAERLSEAEELFEKVLASQEESVNYSLIRGEGYRFLGVLASLDSRPADAFELQRKALKCFADLPYAIGKAKAYNSLGQTCLQMSNYEAAQLFLETAESICLDVGAEAERATILGKLGLVFSKTGEYEKAISYQQQDLEISSRFGNFRALAFSLRNLGRSYRAKGELNQAVTHLRDSRNRFAELEDQALQVKTDLDLVATLLDHNKVTEAFGFLEEAQALLEKRLEVTADHINARYYAGLIALRTENFHRAEEMLWQALEMCQAFGMEKRQADVHYHLARLYLEKNDRDAAIIELRSAYNLAREWSRGNLKYDLLRLLHELDPDSLFEEMVGENNL